MGGSTPEEGDGGVGARTSSFPSRGWERPRPEAAPRPTPPGFVAAEAAGPGGSRARRCEGAAAPHPLPLPRRSWLLP